MEWIWLISGLMLIAAGMGLSLHALYSLHCLKGPAFYPRLRAWLAATLEADPATEPGAEPDAVKPEPAKLVAKGARRPVEVPLPEIFETATVSERLCFEDVPLRQTGRDQHYDLEAWYRMVAWLIYSRLVPGLQGRVGSPLGPTMFKGRVDDPRKLTRFLWTRIFADETVLVSIRSYYSLEPHELEEKLRQGLLDVLEGFLETSSYEFLSETLQLNIYEKNFKQATCFTADFLPLLAKTDAPIHCEAYLVTGAGQGQIMVPGLEQARLQFGDQVFGVKQGYFPLLGETATTIDIGPHPSCHIQTHQQFCEGSLTLGWREAQDMGFVGILEIRKAKPVNGESFYLRQGYLQGHREDTLRSGTRTRLASSEEGARTTYELWRRKGESQNLLLTLVVRNRRPPLDSLPDCAIFEDVFAKFEQEQDLASFLASQIYFATKRQKNLSDLNRLDDAEGQTFFGDDRVGGPIFNRGRKREALRCRVKICVSSTQLNRLHEWFGDREMPSRLAAKLLDVIREEPAYRDAFPGEVLPSLYGGAGTPGLTVDVGSDSALAVDTLLVRCLPVFIPNRRREIYGRLLFDQWPGAVDHSDFSCKDGLTFFTDYPQGVVALHLSRFPVYEVQTPGVFGAIKINLIEAGTAAVRLKLENHSSATLLVEGEPLHRPSAVVVNLEGRGANPIEIQVGERRAQLHIYSEPLAQLDEPHFVPEPARLDLHGLTLHRRLERTGWESARSFQTLWNAASLQENKRLLGVSQVTENGFLAVVERGALIEHHFLAGQATQIQTESVLNLEAGQNTLGRGSLGASCKINETAAANIQVDYQRIDFQQQRVIHANVLTFDYWEFWVDQLEPLVPFGSRIVRVELARCHPQNLTQREAHLYLVETLSSDDQKSYWLWHQPGGIKAVRLRGSQANLVEANVSLAGPLDQATGKLFQVDWEGEEATPVSFDVEDHDDQVRKYLADGFFSLREDAPFQVGGKLAGDSRHYKSSEPIFISGQEVHLHFDPDGNGSRQCLNFNPRDFASFFDKDSFRIYYSGEAQSFVIESQAHRKEMITPKTMFLIVPEGGYPILGSHALSPVSIPSGINYLVLPGLTFKISQGPVYYA